MSNASAVMRSLIIIIINLWCSMADLDRRSKNFNRMKKKRLNSIQDECFYLMETVDRRC